MTADALCVGAHPDDVEIGMGATVAAMVRAGLSVVLCDLTDGEPTPHGTPEKRALEAAAAARVLGAERLTLTLPNRELMDTLDARRALAEVIRDVRPSVVFAPYPVDAHPDHVAAAAICEAARFYAKLTKTELAGHPHYPPRLYHYFAVHLRLLAKPSFIMAVEPVDLQAKLDALGCYESQFIANEKNRGIIEGVRMRAAWWGHMLHREAGEPFFSREEIGVADVRHVL